MSFWDLIQPSFMFMVGVAMPYSYGRRAEQGESFLRMFGHVLARSVVLILLGVFLSSNGAQETNFTFVNVLTQIGLGYLFVFLLLGRGLALQLLAAAAILAGYWHFFYSFPLPPAGFDYSAVGVPGDVPIFEGLFAHWNMNANAASDADLTLLNWFHRSEPFLFNRGGYQTLNFVPSIATMLFGLMAGELMRSSATPAAKFNYLTLAGALLFAAGWAAGMTVCPVVKRIWSPSRALFSSGWTCWMLAAFYWVIDIKGYRRWAFPLVVVGMNSIAMYVMAQLIKPWTWQTLNTHLGWGIALFKQQFLSQLASFQSWLPTAISQPLFDGTFLPIFKEVSILVALWLVCLWLYRQRLFVRI